MKVDDVLKDKKAAWQKERLLDDKALDPAVVDKLASDPSVAVRRKAVRHDKITDVGLWKIVTQKKNFEEEYMLSNAFRKISMELKIKWFKEKKFLDYEKTYIFDKIKWPLLADIDKSSFKDEFAQMMVDGVLGGEFNYSFVRWWLAKYYPVKDDKKLFDKFKKDYPSELIRYRDEIGVGEDDVNVLFDKHVKDSEYYTLHPLSDFGSEFLEKMSGDQITKMLKKMTTGVSQDVMECLKNNPNLTADHTLIIFSIKDYFSSYGGYGYGSNNKPQEYALKNFPLNDVVEKVVFKIIKSADRVPYYIFERLAENKTHNKEAMVDRLAKWDAEKGGWSNTVITNLLDTGMYSEEDFAKIMSNKDDYYVIGTYKEAVKSSGFPLGKLRELWKKYWHEEWKEEKIDGPSYNGSFSGWGRTYEQGKLLELIYNMIKFSPLAGEFGMEYYNKYQDEEYLPEVAKDIFLF